MKNLKNTSKRGFALLLALVMCLGMFQMTAFASEGTELPGEPDPIVTETPAEPPATPDVPDDTDATPEESAPVVDTEEEQPVETEEPKEETEEETEDESEEPTEDSSVGEAPVASQPNRAPEQKNCGIGKHTWSTDDDIKVTTNPSCVAIGTGYHYCKVCGQSKLDVVEIPKLGHDFVVTKNAVELDSIDGRHTVKCTRCPAVETRAHKYVGATCTTPGICVCGKEDPEKKLELNNHTVVTDAAVAATCTTDGKTVGSHCDACKVVINKQEVVKATGHDFSGTAKSYDEKQHETECKNKDCNATEKQDHSFSVAVTVEGSKEVTTYTCSACGHSYKEEKEANCEHKNTHEEITDTTCQKQGHYKLICDDCETVIEEHDCPPVDHEYVGGKCKYCGKCQNIDENGCHKMDKTEHAATCTESGYVEYKCPICGETSPDVVTSKPLGHLPGEFVVKNEPTCTEKGNSTQSCTRCGAELNHASKDALGHDLKYCPGKAATCTEAGTRESWVCNRITADGTPCNAHFLDKDGKTPVTDKADLTIDALGHVFPEEWSDNCAGGIHIDDCNSVQHIKVCTRCDGNQDGGIEYEAHSYGDWKVEKEATTTEAGLRTHACTECHHVETEIIPQLEDTNPTEPPEEKVTVTWLNGYTNTPVKVKNDHVKGAAVAEEENPIIPQRPGYTFNSWGTPVVDANGNITITATWRYNGGGGGTIVIPDPTPGPDEPDGPDDPPIVDIPDDDPPLVDVPDIPPVEPDPPIVDIPDEDPPLVDIPDDNPPLVDRPVFPTRPVTPTTPGLTDIPDEEVPLADAPETGDSVWVWYLTALLSAAGIAVLSVLESKKRAKR